MTFRDDSTYRNEITGPPVLKLRVERQSGDFSFPNAPDLASFVGLAARSASFIQSLWIAVSVLILNDTINSAVKNDSANPAFPRELHFHRSGPSVAQDKDHLHTSLNPMTLPVRPSVTV